jgi:uncharacterized protein (DUF488 family)
MLWSVGHSTRTVEVFIGLLTAHRIEAVVDVRRFPRSRRHPQFNADALPSALAAASIAYVHAPDLGGRRAPRPDSPNTAWTDPGFRGYADHMQTPVFVAELDRLLERARSTRLAIMCAEAVPWRCHRSLIADAVVARGGAVEHILGSTRAQPHVLTPWARVEDARVTYPGLIDGDAGRRHSC